MRDFVKELLNFLNQPFKRTTQRRSQEINFIKAKVMTNYDFLVLTKTEFS